MSIDVRVPHPAYSAAADSIVAARDCYLGERAVKARGPIYLPRLTGQNHTEYAAYKMRATFYSIVGRTVGALVGLSMQGDVRVAGNKEITDQMKDAPHGMQLFEASNKSVLELLLQGRIGFLLDSPEQSMTVGLYAYLSESIINWDTDGEGNYTMVVLQERRLVTDTSNRFKKSEEAQYRVLELQNGVYTVTVYDAESKQLKAPIQPRFNGQTIDFIPFFTALPDGVSAGVTKSPMEDLVAVNLSHYRTSADLEHGRHFCGLPTPVITGSEVSGKMRIGSSTAWVLPEKDARAEYLEFTGQGLQSLEKAMTEKEAQLSSLSSSVISRSMKGSESPDAIRLRMSSETASLYTIVKTVETLMNLVYNTKAKLEKQPEDVSLTYPTQFVSGQITADELAKYSDVYLKGGMPVEDYVAILRRGGALSANRQDNEVKSELDAIAAERAAAAAAAATKNQPTTP